MTKTRPLCRARYGILFAFGMQLGLMTSGVSAADSLTLKDASVSFEATGKPGFLRIQGENGVAEGELSVDHDVLTGGVVKVQLDTLKTGLELRDEHMKEKYLETTRFPQAIFKIDPVKVALGTFASETALPGTLTIHGVSKPAQIKIKATKQAEAYEGSATIDLNVSDFAIPIPEYLGIKVADKVKVKAQFHAVVKPAKPTSIP